MITIDTASLNAVLTDYLKVQRKSIDEALRNQARYFSLRLFSRLKKKSATAAKITAQTDSLLASKRGIIVRQRAKDWVMRKYGVRTNLKTGRQFGVDSKRKRVTKIFWGESLWQMMIKREIAMRRQAAGFTAWSVLFPKNAEDAYSKRNRGGELVATRIIKTDPHGNTHAVARFDWSAALSESSGSAAEILSKPENVEDINGALQESAQSMVDYIRKRLDRAPSYMRAKYSL